MDESIVRGLDLVAKSEAALTLFAIIAAAILWRALRERDRLLLEIHRQSIERMEEIARDLQRALEDVCCVIRKIEKADGEST